MPDPPLLGRVLPRFAAEVEAALAQEHPELASQVRGLEIGRVCSCDDPGCATFDVPGRRPSDYDFCLELEELSGMVLIDLAKRPRGRRARAGSGRRIIGVETLRRPDLRKQFDAHPEIVRSPSAPP